MTKTWNELLEAIGSTQAQVDEACKLNTDLNYNLSKFQSDFDTFFLSKPQNKSNNIQDAVVVEDLFKTK